MMKKIYDPVVTENTVKDIDSPCVVEAELIRPPSMPEMSHIIVVTGRNILMASDIVGDTVNAEGKTCFTVVYMDMTGECHSFESSAKFTHSFQAEGADSDCTVRLDAVMRNIDFRMLTGGSVAVKAYSSFRGNVFRKCEYECSIDGSFSDDELHCLSREIDVPRRIATKSSLFTKREDIRLPQNLPTVQKILDISGYAIVKNVSVESMRVTAEGDIRIDVLYESTDRNAPLMHYSASVSFGEMIDCTDVAEGDIAGVLASISEIDAACYEGSEDMITVEASVKLTADVYRKAQISVLSDIYSTKKAIVQKGESARMRGLTSFASAKSIMRASVSLPENAPDISRTLYCSSNVSAEKAESHGGYVTVTGNIYTKMCYSCLNGSIYTASVETPFTQELSCDGASDESEIRLQCEIEYFEVEGSGRDADVKFALETAIENYTCASADIVTEAKASEEELAILRGIYVYVAQKKESAWDICKRYHISEEALSSMNPTLDTGNIQKGDKIVIFP